MPITHNIWTDEMEQVIRDMYPTMPMSDILMLLPGVTAKGIYQRAAKLGVSRWNQGTAPVGSAINGMATEAEIGWIAGFIDGEGTIQLRRQNRKDGRFYLQPCVRVVNNDREAAEKVQRIMGGMLTNAPSRPKLWLNVLSGVVQVEKFIRKIIDHLTVKKERCLILLEYAELRQSKLGKAPYGSQERELYDRFYMGSGRKNTTKPHGVCQPRAKHRA